MKEYKPEYLSNSNFINDLDDTQKARYIELCKIQYGYVENRKLTKDEYNEWVELDRIVYPPNPYLKNLTRDYTEEELWLYFD